MSRLNLPAGIVALVSLVIMVAAGTTAVTAREQPSLTVTAPQNGAKIEGFTVRVEFTAEGINIVPSTVAVEDAGKKPEANRPGEGHVHLMLDLLPLVIWESTEPYTFENVPPGSHELMVELVNNDHSPLSPPVVRHIHFQSGGPQLVPRTGASEAASVTPALLAMLAIGALLAPAGVLLRRRPVRRAARHPRGG